MQDLVCVSVCMCMRTVLYKTVSTKFTDLCEQSTIVHKLFMNIAMCKNKWNVLSSFVGNYMN